jgi:hypothetical protein
MEALIGVLVFGALILGMWMSRKADPRDSAAGRWGIKAGKVARGEFGGKKWGERKD